MANTIDNNAVDPLFTCSQPSRKRKKLVRTALTLREKAIVKSFCEEKVNNCKDNGELVPSQEVLRQEVATQFGWSCGRSTLSKIISMDWKILRGSYEGGNTPRNPDMKRHRRPLFPAFEADLVQFIITHLEAERRDESVLQATQDVQSRNKNSGAIALLTARNKGMCDAEGTAGGYQGRPLTEALILEEAQRLKKVHGVSDDMLVLSVGWLARFKHRHCIRLRKPAGMSNCLLPLHYQPGFVVEENAELTDSCSSSLIVSSLSNTHDASKMAATDATTEITSNDADLLPRSTRLTEKMELAGNSPQLTLAKGMALCSAQWYQEAMTKSLAASPLTVNAKLLHQVPESIRELACSCQGSAICGKLFNGFAGLRVAVVGCGSVFEAFLTAALVGVNGFVTCVEASAANVNLAQQAAESYCLVTLGLPAVNMKFVARTDGDMIQSSSSSCVSGDELKDLQGQQDLVICNCSIQSLAFPASKNAMLKVAFGLLKVGGELRMVDLVSSRRLSSFECESARLAAETSAVSEGSTSGHECSKQLEQTLLLGAPYIGDLRRRFRALGGNAEVRSVSCNEAEAATIDVAVASLLPSLAAANNVRFRRVTFHAFRLEDVEDPCEDYGQTAIFHGYDAQNNAASGTDVLPSYQLDDHWNFQRGVWTPIDGNTAQILQTSWLQRYFSVRGDRSRHCGPFVASVYSKDCPSSVSQLAALAPSDTMRSIEVVKPVITDQPSCPISSSSLEPLEMINI
ncbi:unnamed protein product [Peronospora belbahrii]|uniref:HTH CENPB-type domain-containing protein n=1 Tax=Peronospora belbahrii TaxID=622444 RepID=A0AAU9L489_9STRA|nr:unnamed protein product [Peronospora belbahrii]CAH0514723.1 unnamed protein product [Peronospora belbahrii]